MSDLELSVIMPVYNCGAYLREAIDSILHQTFPAFEFIIINDGSTDESERIILSYNDPRIVYIKNETNRGLVYTLNYGVSLAKGKLIARMDGDDISLPERFAKQIAYMNMQPNVSILAGFIEMINEKGQPLGYWKEDRDNTTYEQIREFMPGNNCIAHPSVMARANVLKTYLYRAEQSQAEDYDLWLRLLSAGEVIHKLSETLVLYRILPGSFTRTRQQNVFFKLATTKSRFAFREISEGNMNLFVFRTLLFSSADTLKGIGKMVKKLLSPIVGK